MRAVIADNDHGSIVAGAAKFGDTLTYALTVSATGNLPQSNVVVTDPVPAGTTYVPSSAGCDAGTCTVAVTQPAPAPQPSHPRGTDS